MHLHDLSFRRVDRSEESQLNHQQQQLHQKRLQAAQLLFAPWPGNVCGAKEIGIVATRGVGISDIFELFVRTGDIFMGFVALQNGHLSAWIRKSSLLDVEVSD